MELANFGLYVGSTHKRRDPLLPAREFLVMYTPTLPVHPGIKVCWAPIKMSPCSLPATVLNPVPSGIQLRTGNRLWFDLLQTRDSKWSQSSAEPGPLSPSVVTDVSFVTASQLLPVPDDSEPHLLASENLTFVWVAQAQVRTEGDICSVGLPSQNWRSHTQRWFTQSERRWLVQGCWLPILPRRSL